MTTTLTLPTIWHIPDRLWKKIKPLLGREKRSGTPRRPVMPYRTVLDGILYVLRTGCQWKRAPEKFGSGSTLHRRFQLWRRRGVFTRRWRIMLREYDSRRGIRWLWQVIDSCMTKAPLGGEATGKNPTDRGKSGTKRHVVCDQRGAPLGLCVTGANRHDKRVALRAVDAITVDRPKPSACAPQHLCGDKGYDFADVREGLDARGYTAHIPVRGAPASTGERIVSPTLTAVCKQADARGRETDSLTILKARENLCRASSTSDHTPLDYSIAESLVGRRP